MEISNRVKKQYSEKLFNELCILCCLIYSGNKADNYILDLKLGVSKRTLYRYFKELRETGITPLIKAKASGYYAMEECDDDCYPDNHLEEYISDIDESSLTSAHQRKLYRTAWLIITNANRYYKNDDDDFGNFTSELVHDGIVYGFHDFDSLDSLYTSLSQRTQFREVALVKKVIKHMFEY